MWFLGKIVDELSSYHYFSSFVSGYAGCLVNVIVRRFALCITLDGEYSQSHLLNPSPQSGIMNSYPGIG